MKAIAILAGKVVLLAILLVIFFMVGAQISGLSAAPAGAEPAPEDAGATLAVLFVSSLVQAAVLAAIILRSRWSGWKLTGALFIAFYGSMTVIPQLESLVYLQVQLPAGLIPKLFIMGAIVAGLFSPAAVLILGKRHPAAAAGSGDKGAVGPFREWIWKLLPAVVVYLILYYSFGYFVAWKNPAVRAYYGGTDPGNFFAQLSSVWASTPWMFPFQALRALLWIVLVLPMIRMLKGRSWQIGLLTALFFSMLSLQLLLPNPYMPVEVSRAHFWETISSNFIFGWFLGWLLGDPDPR